MLICLSFSLTAIECLPLPDIENGMISYSTDTSANYSLGTTATYSCNDGYFLSVTESTTVVRTCQDDDGMDAVGVFSGQAPRCVRKLPLTIMTIFIVFPQLYCVPFLILTMETSLTLLTIKLIMLWVLWLLISVTLSSHWTCLLLTPLLPGPVWIMVTMMLRAFLIDSLQPVSVSTH